MVKFKNLILAFLMISFSLKSIGLAKFFDLTKTEICCEEGDNSCEKSNELSKPETNDVFLNINHPFALLFSMLLSQKVFCFKPVIFFPFYLSIFSPPPEI
jgi:hypothetical protein